jgi:hypothetical protein
MNLEAVTQYTRVKSSHETAASVQPEAHAFPLGERREETMVREISDQEPDLAQIGDRWTLNAAG